MTAWMVLLFAGALPTPQHRVDEHLSILQLPEALEDIKSPVDLGQLADSIHQIFEAFRIEGRGYKVAERPATSSPPKLSGGNPIPAHRIHEPPAADEPRPLGDLKPLEFPASSSTCALPSAPAPLAPRSPVDLSPDRLGNTGAEDAPSTNLSPADVNPAESGSAPSMDIENPREIEGSNTARYVPSGASGSEAEVRARVRMRRAAIEVTAQGPTMNFKGREAIYAIVVSNPGEVEADDVKVVASLPRGLRLTVLGRPVDFDRRTNTMVWMLERLAAGESETLQFKLKALEEGEHIQQVAASAAGGLHAESCLATRVIARPQINVVVINRDGPLAVATAARFEIALKNVGTKAAEHVRVKVITPKGLDVVAGDGAAAERNELVFAPMRLAVGQNRTLQFRAIGRKPGDYVVRVLLKSDSPSRPRTVEGSVFFYDADGQSSVSGFRSACR